MLNELNNLINIRNYLGQLQDNLSINLSNEKARAITNKITLLDNKISTAILMMDIDKEIDDINRVFEKVQSTKIINSIEDIDKIYASQLAQTVEMEIVKPSKKRSTTTNETVRR